MPTPQHPTTVSASGRVREIRKKAANRPRLSAMSGLPFAAYRPAALTDETVHRENLLDHEYGRSALCAHGDIALRPPSLPLTMTRRDMRDLF